MLIENSDQEIIDFKTEDENLTAEEKVFTSRTPELEEKSEYFPSTPAENTGEHCSMKNTESRMLTLFAAKKTISTVEAVDFTPPHLISALITENGVMTPSAVSESLISVWLG